MILPSFKHYKFAKVVPYASMMNLGIPMDESYPNNVSNNYYMRNCWALFEHDGFLYVGGGNAQGGSQGSTIGSDTQIRCHPVAIDLSDDSTVVVPYQNPTGQTTVEIRTFSAIDGLLHLHSIDAKGAPDADDFTLVNGEFVHKQITSNRNHMYALHKSRRNGHFFACTGIAEVEHNVISRATTYAGYPVNSGSGGTGAQNRGGARANAIFEFGPAESSRLICLCNLNTYTPFSNSSINNYLRDPVTPEGSTRPKTCYEFNFADNTFTPLTNYALVGLERTLSHPRIWPTSTNAMLAIQDMLCVQNATPLNENEYICRIERTSSSNGQSRGMPGVFFHRNYGVDGIHDITIYGGIYKVTLGSTPPFAAANGTTFLNCERMLPNPEITGRQWDFKVVGSDVYILTETKDLRVHVYKNKKRIITIPDMPTYARSFAVIGNHIYFGLGTEARDSFRQNGDTVNSQSGTILKAENVLADIP